MAPRLHITRVTRVVLVRVVLLALAAVALLASAPGCQRSRADSPRGAAKPSAKPGAKIARPLRTVLIVKRAGKVHDYPCNKCHDKITPNLARPTPLKKHTRVSVKHFKGADACYGCHDRRDMNKLALISGEAVSYDASYELCGQCHGEKRRDFDIGAHGKLVGRWRGTAHKYNCVDCHDPHHPKHPRVKALPAPPFPARGIRKGEHGKHKSGAH